MAAGAFDRFVGAAALTVFGGVAIGAGLAPIGAAPGGLPGPDLLWCVVALWSARRPTLAPAALVFALGLARDLLGGGPVGAGALGLLVGALGVRAQADRLRRRGFAAEWGVVALWGLATVAVPWLMLTLTLAPTPPLERLAGALAATALTYPLLALALRWAARPAPGAPAAARGA